MEQILITTKRGKGGKKCLLVLNVLLGVVKNYPGNYKHYSIPPVPGGMRQETFKNEFNAILRFTCYHLLNSMLGSYALGYY